MINSVRRIPEPVNEPVLSYAPGSREKRSLKAKLHEMLGREIEIPLIIGGKEVRTGSTKKVVCPHDHGHVLAVCHQAGPTEVERAVAAARLAWQDWSEMHWVERAAVFSLLKWTSPRSNKENFVPPSHFSYPLMQEE